MWSAIACFFPTHFLILLSFFSFFHAYSYHTFIADEEKQKEKTGGTGEKQGTSYTDDNLADIIDYVLSSMDLNKDGYVDYLEYRKSEVGSAKGNNQ